MEQVAAGTITIEAADTKTLTWDDIRSTRDQLLKETDWTMTTGATVDQAQWAAYRQVIRDILRLIKIKLQVMLFGRLNHQQKVLILKN